MNLALPIRLALLLSAIPLTAHALTPSQVFEQVKDSVVIIKTLDAKGEEKSQGSGVLLPSGKVVTNCHVVKDGASFEAGRGKNFVPAILYAGDADKDLCLLQADKLGGTPAQIGKAAGLTIGEAVYAVGAPQGLELSLSDGIVSQLRGSPIPLIQTTAAISPGSSGGGLFDSEARLVGLTTLYHKDGQSLNFALPVEWLAELKPGTKTVSNQRTQIDWFISAAALEEKQDWPGLLALGQQWSKIEPRNAHAWFFVGHAHQGLNQLAPAISAYRATLRIDSEYAAAWGNLGGTYVSLKRYDDAIAANREVLRINPEDAKAWNNLGFTYETLERYDDAVAAYRQALRINPEEVKTWSNLGSVYATLERYDDAIAAYRQALHINPEESKAWIDLGIIYGQHKRYDDAITAYRQALRINPEDSFAWSGLIGTYYFSGNTTAALQAVKTLHTLDPAKAEMLFNMIVPR